MPSTLSTNRLTTPDNTLVVPRPTPAKATLHDKTAEDFLSGVVIEAAKRAWGKQGAAAAQLDKNEANFSRDVKAGRITTAQLKALGPGFLAELGKELIEEFGPLANPKDEARRAIRDIEERLNLLRQFVDVA